MNKKEIYAIVLAGAAGALVFFWLDRSAALAPAPGDTPSPQGIGMLQAYPEPHTATPAASGGVFPTPDPNLIPSRVLGEYSSFGEYASSLATAEASIEGGVTGVVFLGETSSTWVNPCSPTEGFGFHPANKTAKQILLQLVNGGGPPRVQGLYREGEDIFVMVVTGLTSAQVAWPSTPTPWPTATGTPGSEWFVSEPIRSPVLSYVPAQGYAVGVSLIASSDNDPPAIRGLYACEEGYYKGIENLYFGWNVDSIYYARN